MPSATIVIPTRGRPGYLDAALQSIVPQARDAGAELLVVSDGPDAATAAVAARHGARLVALPAPSGLNAARNEGIAVGGGELIVFVDDDVRAPAAWLGALLEGAAGAPDHDVFGGPISAVLEGGGPRACGREPAPITTLDLGPDDRDAEFAWGANMAIRRRAFDRLGGFDESIFGLRGDEEAWLHRYLDVGGRIRYLAGAGLEHRRTADDSTVRRLAAASYGHGRAARRNDIRKGTAPTLRAELRTLAGCLWHTVRRRCAIGIVMAAHSAGRIREALSPQPDPQTPDFGSGTSGQVFGLRATSAALLRDALADTVALVTGRNARVARAAARTPRRRVLALGIERASEANLLDAARQELLRSHHEVTFTSTDVGGRGKFENLNLLLRDHPADGYDWLLVLDDDVVLPRGFLDEFLFLAERFELQLAQPAHRALSHAAWDVTRRRPVSLVRETAFVEIGPVFAFRAVTFSTLLPFPELRIGWGLDAHWSAIALARGWRLGVVDATPIRHTLRRIAATYDRESALAEAREFLAGRPYTRTVEAQRTRVTHRSLR